MQHSGFAPACRRTGREQLSLNTYGNSGTALVDSEGWAGLVGDRWLANLERLEAMVAPITAQLLARADYRPGERVVEIGSGGGAEAIAIARQVGEAGAVLGVDISPRLIAAAARRREAANLANVQFLLADAETVVLPGQPCDRLFSNFGALFFRNPNAGYANFARMLRPGGRADLAAWGPARQNPWGSAVLAVFAEHLGLPAPMPRAPGPFAMDDPDYISALLGGGGFRRVEILPWQGHLLVGGPGLDAAQATTYAVSTMALDLLLQTQEPAVQSRLLGRVTALFDRHRTPDGILMPAMAWLVSATR